MRLLTHQETAKTLVALTPLVDDQLNVTIAVAPIWLTLTDMQAAGSVDGGVAAIVQEAVSVAVKLHRIRHRVGNGVVACIREL